MRGLSGPPAARQSRPAGQVTARPEPATAHPELVEGRAVAGRRPSSRPLPRPRLPGLTKAWLRAALLLALLLLPSAPARADRWHSPDPVLGIIDAGRRADAARAAGAGWDRVLFLWQEIQPNGPEDWQLDRYIDKYNLRPTLESGFPLVAVVQGTPSWAAADPRLGAAAVPAGLQYPFDDPRNRFGRFIRSMAARFKTHVQAWIIWNEPDFQPADSQQWLTWNGSTFDFQRMLRTAWLNIRAVDPSARVVFPATAYFPDATSGRELFLSRVLKDIATDTDAKRNGFYFDAVAVNLYCSLNAIYAVQGQYQQLLSTYGLSKPLWLTETNCPVNNDPTSPPNAPSSISTSEQAGFLLQSVAMARAAGYQRIGWYTMIDHDPRIGIAERWGLLRLDNTPRPAYSAMQVASRYLGSSSQLVRFVPSGTESATGNWPVWRVVADDPDARTRVQVIWRGTGGPDQLRVRASGADAAALVDQLGRTYPAPSQQGWRTLRLPPLRVPQPRDPPGYRTVGDPILLVETNVDPTLPPATPALEY